MNKLTTYTLLTVAATGLIAAPAFAHENHFSVASAINKSINKEIQAIKKNVQSSIKNLRNTAKIVKREEKKKEPQTVPANIVAFRAAIKTAQDNYQAQMKAARQAYEAAMLKARNDYLKGYQSSTIPTNTAPTVATAATASPSTVTGNSTNLSVLGADANGEGTLTYFWSVTSKPDGASDPLFNINNSNAAKNVTATFTKAGNYTFKVTITDNYLLNTSSSVNVTVNQTLSNVYVTPSSITLNMGSSTQFSATSTDQFSNPVSSLFSWVLSEGSTGGSINSSGYYTAPSATGTFHVIGSSSVDPNKKATSTVTVQ